MRRHSSTLALSFPASRGKIHPTTLSRGASLFTGIASENCVLLSVGRKGGGEWGGLVREIKRTRRRGKLSRVLPSENEGACICGCTWGKHVWRCMPRRVGRRTSRHPIRVALYLTQDRAGNLSVLQSAEGMRGAATLRRGVTHARNGRTISVMAAARH